MNTREREVMDELYRFASHTGKCDALLGLAGVPCNCGLIEARVAYSALLAEGSSEGAEAVDWQVRRTGFMPGEEPEWMRISKEDFDNPRRFVTSAWERRALYIHPQSAQEGAVAVGLPLRHRLFCVFAHSSEFNMNVRIPGHIGTMEEIRESVMGKARREGYQGDFVERMAELRWWLVPLYTHPQPAQGEQFHMSQAAVTVADVARLIECKVADVLRAGRDKCSLTLTANQMVSVEDAVLLARWTLHEQRGMRAALESALPRGLPAGSDSYDGHS